MEVYVERYEVYRRVDAGRTWILSGPCNLAREVALLAAIGVKHGLHRYRHEYTRRLAGMSARRSGGAVLIRTDTLIVSHTLRIADVS